MQGLPAAFANQAFGRFLDLKHSGPITADASRAVLRVVSVLSESYIDTTTVEFKQAMAKAGRPGFQGGEIVSKERMMDDRRFTLHTYLKQVLSAPYLCLTLIPWRSFEDRQR